MPADGKQNLTPVRTKEEARERGRNGGIKSGEARRKKKSLKEMAKYLMESPVSNELPNVRDGLTRMGVPKKEQTYQAAVAARLVQRAMMDGDPSSIRLLGELTGDFGRGIDSDEDARRYGGTIDVYGTDVIDGEIAVPSIRIPHNGRDDIGNAISPQPGPQTMFMISPADIVIYGGAAGGGKTYALLMEMLRHKDVRGFGSVIFRRNYTQISSEGGLWDSSHKVFDNLPDAHARRSPKLHWDFDAGSRLGFDYIGSEEGLLSWQGSQICYLGFDELTHFSRHMFLYMLSRNRSTCGVRPYVRATCNPDADSWVADFISWWIDQDTGYPIPERSGKIRWMTIVNDVIYWSDDPEELAREHDMLPEQCKSVTFIASKVTDNQVLIRSDPGYIANLKALTEVDTERLLNGNWKIRPHAGMFFKRTQIGQILDDIPDGLVAVCRGWDLAATDKDENQEAAFTAGVLMGKTATGRFVVLDVINRQLKAGEVRTLIVMTSKMDRQSYGKICPVRVRLPQDPGQAGKEQAQSYMQMLAGYDVKIIGESGDKQTRAEPMAAQWQHGFFDIVSGDWNDEYLGQLESFPEGKWKDMVDASSSAFSELTYGMSNISGGLIYVTIADAFMADDQDANPFLITEEELKMVQGRFGEVNVGLHFGINGSGLALVATTNQDAYDSLIVLKATRYIGENVDPDVTCRRVLEFTQKVGRKYGRVANVYYQSGEAVLPKDLKNAFMQNDMASIKVRPSIDVQESDKINTVNRLAAKCKIGFIKGECGMLIEAMLAASWEGTSKDLHRLENNTVDTDSLQAFEMSFERNINRYMKLKG